MEWTIPGKRVIPKNDLRKRFHSILYILTNRCLSANIPSSDIYTKRQRSMLHLFTDFANKHLADLANVNECLQVKNLLEKTITKLLISNINL